MVVQFRYSKIYTTHACIRSSATPTAKAMPRNVDSEAPNNHRVSSRGGDVR